MKTACPGCGVLLDPLDGPTHPYMLSTPACWRLFGEVLAREYADPRLLPTHRLSVDAYAVQHPGGADRQSIQSVALHLCRLHVTLDREPTPEQANELAVALAERRSAHHWLPPPSSRGQLTVAHVHQADEPVDHVARVRAWARSAYDAWREHHPQVAIWTKDLGL